MDLNDLHRELPRYDIDGVEFRDGGVVVHFAPAADLDHPSIKKFTTLMVGHTDDEDLGTAIRELVDSVQVVIDEALRVQRHTPDRIRRRS